MLKDWTTIAKANRDILNKYPISELVFCEMYMTKAAKREKVAGYYLLKVIFIWIWGKLNKIGVYNFNAEAVIGITTNRANDWGVFLPFIEEFEKRERKYYLFAPQVVINKHKEQLRDLKYGQILDEKNRHPRYLLKNQIGDLTRIITEWKNVRHVIKGVGIGGGLEYVYTYYNLLSIANGLYSKYLHHTKYIFSLGESLYGMLYQTKGIKHYGMQHGYYPEGKIGDWPNCTPSNVTVELCWGEASKKLIENAYDVSCMVVGNSNYAMEKIVPNYNSRNIVFFSETHGIEESNMKHVYETMDMLLRMQKKLKDGYKIKIKLHPNEREEIFTEYNATFGQEIEIISGREKALNILADCKVALSWGNTCNLEAALFGILSVQLTGMENYDKLEFAYQVHNEEQLIYLLESEKIIEIIKKNQHEAERYVSPIHDVANYTIEKLCT